MNILDILKLAKKFETEKNIFNPSLTFFGDGSGNVTDLFDNEHVLWNNLEQFEERINKFFDEQVVKEAPVASPPEENSLSMTELLKQYNEQNDTDYVITLNDEGQTSLTSFDYGTIKFNSEQELYEELTRRNTLSYKNIMLDYEHYGFLDDKQVQYLIALVDQLSYTLTKVRELANFGQSLDKNFREHIVTRIDQTLDKI